MTERPTSATSPLLRKMASIFNLAEEEHAALASLPMQIADVQADQDVVRKGDRSSRCCLLIEGFACTYKITGDGKRQIMALNIPGDIPDLLGLHLRVLDSSIGTLTPCKVGFIEHEALDAICMRYPRIGSAFWRTTLIDASIFREWITNIGQRDANSRMAHVLCELVVRMKAAGLAQDHTCSFPITQSQLGDVLAMSSIHASRALQELRAQGLISLKGNVLTVLDWAGLQQAGDFEPTYLHLDHGQEAAA